jgi:MYXO-CTERM domain-containing protein
MPLGPYTGLTLIGSAVWCFVLAGIGWGIGTGYGRFHRGFDYASILIAALALLTAAGLVRRRRRPMRGGAHAEES